MANMMLVSWAEFQQAARELAKAQLPVEQWKGIIAVSRGGLLPAAILARELGIRLVDTVCIASYHEHAKQGELQVLKAAEGDGKGYLLVDDLVDTGNTAKVLRELYPQAKFVTLYAKPQGAPLVDQHIVDVPQDTWIQLPWDMEGLEFVEPLVKQ